MNKNLSIQELLTELVSIPSVNPRLKYAPIDASEEKLSQYVKSVLTSAGIEVDIQKVESNRYNIIGHVHRGELSDNKLILLCSHMDTYPASVDDVKEFTPRIVGSELIGRGSADAKGPLAAMMNAFITAAKSPYRREAYFVATIDEEFEMKGVKKLAQYGIRPDLAITGEPTKLIPIIKQKGVMRSHIRIHGEVGHSAYPKSKNSIFSAGKILEGIEQFNHYLAANHDEPTLTAANCTPTRIIGDGDMNSTPCETSIWFDARYLPKLSAQDFLMAFKNFLSQNIGEQHTFDIAEPWFTSPPNSCSLENPLVIEFIEATKKIVGHCTPESFSYGSEAGVLAEFSKASLVFGPGDPKYSHKENERVDLNEVAAAAKIFYSLLTGGHGEPYHV